jgi:DNA mismatch repair protein MutL
MLPPNEHPQPARAPHPAAPAAISSSATATAAPVPAAPPSALPAPRILPPTWPAGIQKSTTPPPPAPPAPATTPAAQSAIPHPPSAIPRPQSAIRHPQSAFARVAPAWRYLGLAHATYALFETASGLVLLDRRAAHERIWFERLRDQFRSGEVPSQRLLLPVPVELDAIATALLLDRLDFFNRHGFEITEFGRNFFRIESVPVWMEPADAEPFVRDLLGALREGRLQDKSIDLARDELARLAIAKAIRLPATLGESEIRSTLGHLFACETPLTSPTGRPTFIELSQSELARRFAR